MTMSLSSYLTRRNSSPLCRLSYTSLSAWGFSFYCSCLHVSYFMHFTIYKSIIILKNWPPALGKHLIILSKFNECVISLNLYFDLLKPFINLQHQLFLLIYQLYRLQLLYYLQVIRIQKNWLCALRITLCANQNSSSFSVKSKTIWLTWTWIAEGFIQCKKCNFKVGTHFEF